MLRHRSMQRRARPGPGTTRARSASPAAPAGPRPARPACRSRAAATRPTTTPTQAETGRQRLADVDDSSRLDTPPPRRSGAAASTASRRHTSACSSAGSRRCSISSARGPRGVDQASSAPVIGRAGHAQRHVGPLARDRLEAQHLDRLDPDEGHRRALRAMPEVLGQRGVDGGEDVGARSPPHGIRRRPAPAPHASLSGTTRRSAAPRRRRSSRPARAAHRSRPAPRTVPSRAGRSSRTAR